jgi:zinc protease
VTSSDLQRVATTYLTRANRTVIDRKPQAMLTPPAAHAHGGEDDHQHQHGAQ